MILPPLANPRVLATIWQTFGAEGLARRALHEVRSRFGHFDARPRQGTAPTCGPTGAFALDLDRIAATTDPAAARARAARVLQGEYQAFRSEWRTLPRGRGWLRHPRTGHEVDDGPWWRLPLLDRRTGDIKEIWEPARFAWVYDLIRGYAVDRDSKYQAAFARVLADWAEHSAPYRGPHWACGQEAAIRAIALLYAEAAFDQDPEWSAESRRRIAEVLWWSGARIRDGIGYALSQRNNHAISEAVGLLAIGDRFKVGARVAGGWHDTGKRLLRRLVREQFASDGWYTQHSFVYARLAADQCVVADRVLRRSGQGGLDQGSKDRLAALADLLNAVVLPESGEVPNYGASDGSFVHPVTLSAYRDFRPLLTALAAVTNRQVESPIRPDEEVPAWLGLASPRVSRSGRRRPAVEHGPSGWAVLRAGPAQVFLRAGTYRSRPGHLDPLHVDVRWGGREVIVDPGTCSYNGSRGWPDAMADAAIHNGPVVDGELPGRRGPRFLWYAWPTARLCAVSSDPPKVVAELLGRVRRTVTVDDAGVTIVDEVLCPWKNARCVWLLHPDADVAMVTGADRLVEAVEEDAAGWFSPTYSTRIASRYLLTERAGTDDLLQRIVIAPSARDNGS